MDAPWPTLTVLRVEGITFAVLALLYATVGARTREAGLRTLAVAFTLTAAWYLHADLLVFTGPNIDTPQLRLSAMLIGTAVLAIVTGMLQYLGMPTGWHRAATLAALVPGAMLVLALTVSGRVPRVVFQAGVLLAYAGPAVLAFRRAAQQPGEGHAILGAGLVVLPLLPFSLRAAGVAPMQLQYIAGLSVLVFGMAVLAISLLRRHAALAAEIERRAAAQAQLREANARLEDRVAQRTAHLRELIEGLEAFTRGVSHDLRGPLGGMSELARMATDALDQGDTTIAQRALPLIAGQCDASARMVAAMLDLARLGEANVRRVPVSLGEVARAAYDEVMLSLPGVVRPSFHCATMPAVLGDPDLLRAVFVNLVGNAVKFTRAAAAPRIDIEATSQARDVTVCVSDNGIGFDAATAARLFEPFYRAHDGRYEGHGLGLSIVRRAVQAMGGTVSAHAGQGGGARLCFTLPGALREIDAGAAVYEEPQTLPADRAGSTNTDISLVYPPPEEMQVLRELARRGNMRSMRERAEHLKRLDPRYAEFAARLATLADGYQSRAITALVEGQAK